jgi:uncharacterized damage-inducible protein DinB
MPTDEEIEFPAANDDERELLLEWLRYLRGAVVRDLEGLDEEQAHWAPDGALLPLVGIVNHLTRVEWRWIDGGFLGAETSRSEDEFRPGSEMTVDGVLRAYAERETATEATVRALPLTQRLRDDSYDLRWVLIHLINETARHAGHADAVRELLDGTTGE